MLVMIVHSNWSALWNPCSSNLSFITFSSRAAFSIRAVIPPSIRFITSWAGSTTGVLEWDSWSCWIASPLGRGCGRLGGVDNTLCVNRKTTEQSIQPQSKHDSIVPHLPTNRYFKSESVNRVRIYLDKKRKVHRTVMMAYIPDWATHFDH